MKNFTLNIEGDATPAAVYLINGPCVKSPLDALKHFARLLPESSPLFNLIETGAALEVAPIDGPAVTYTYNVQAGGFLKVLKDQTMKTQHTPGPWQVVSHSTAGQIAIATQGPMPSVYCIGKNKEVNARLIAAAPELLAALERCIPCLQAAIDELGSREDKACLAQARKVIKKARGA